jgi:hypothetical protein
MRLRQICGEPHGAVELGMKGDVPTLLWKTYKVQATAASIFKHPDKHRSKHQKQNLRTPSQHEVLYRLVHRGHEQVCHLQDFMIGFSC